MTTKVEKKMDWVDSQEGTDPFTLSEMEKVGVARLIDRLKGTQFEDKLSVFELAQFSIVSHGDEEEGYERLLKREAFERKIGKADMEMERILKWAEEHMSHIELSFETDYGQGVLYHAKEYKTELFFKGMVMVKPVPEAVQLYHNYVVHRFNHIFHNLTMIRSGFLCMYDMRGTSARYGPKRYSFDKMNLERSGVYPARMRRIALVADGIAHKVIKNIMAIPKLVPEKMKERLRVFKSGEEMIAKGFAHAGEVPQTHGGSQPLLTMRQAMETSKRLYEEAVGRVVLYEPHPHSGPHVDPPVMPPKVEHEEPQPTPEPSSGSAGVGETKQGIEKLSLGDGESVDDEAVVIDLDAINALQQQSEDEVLPVD